MVARTIGNYLIERKLGEGGMGIVYLGVHPRIGRKVAVKTLKSGHSAEEVSRFFVEAKACADLRNPHIVDIYDFGEDETLGAYIIMEFLDGQSLRETLKDSQPLLPERVAHIAIGIATALSAAHERHIIHRDLKPDNVFLTQSESDRDFVKVLDFGVAKLLASEEEAISSTKTGAILGTPAYMAPEQCLGGVVDPRADIYSLGVILFHMLTGKLPFSGQAMAQMHAHIYTPAPSPRTIEPSVPGWLERVTLKAMAKLPQERWQTMRELIAALAAADRVVATTNEPVLYDSEETLLAPSDVAPGVPAADKLAGQTGKVPTADEPWAARNTDVVAPQRNDTYKIAALLLVLISAAVLGAFVWRGHPTTPVVVAPPAPRVAPIAPRVAPVAPPDAPTTAPQPQVIPPAQVKVTDDKPLVKKTVAVKPAAATPSATKPLVTHSPKPNAQPTAPKPGATSKAPLETNYSE